MTPADSGALPGLSYSAAEQVSILIDPRELNALAEVAAKWSEDGNNKHTVRSTAAVVFDSGVWELVARHLGVERARELRNG